MDQGMDQAKFEKLAITQYEKELKRKKQPQKNVNKIWNAICTILLIPIILTAIAFVGVRIVGLTPYSVLSGSMTPQYKVGDLVYIKKTVPEKIKTGDAITFVNDNTLSVVTHRVVEADIKNGCFRTKGDANDNIDGKEVLFENVLGVVVFSIPKLGYLSSFLIGPSGKYVAVAVTLTLVLILFIIPELLKLRSTKNHKQEEILPITKG